MLFAEAVRQELLVIGCWLVLVGCPQVVRGSRREGWWCPSLSGMRGLAVGRVVLVILASLLVLTVVAVGTYWLVRATQDSSTSFPIVTASPSATASPGTPAATAGTSSPTVSAPSPPAFPAEAAAETTAGATAFVQWWFAELNYASATGDTTRLRQYSAAECTACQNFLDQIDGAYSAGGRIEGGAIRVEPEGARPGDSSESIVVDLVVSSESGTVVDSSGQVTESFSADAPSAARAVVVYDDGPLMSGTGARSEAA